MLISESRNFYIALSSINVTHFLMVYFGLNKEGVPEGNVKA